MIQNSELPHDLILLVQTRQMEALLGPNWTTAVRECSPNAIELYKDMVGAFRRLHAHVSFESALIGEEVWFYQIPENARGIYIPTPAAEAIDPGRCTVPREDHLAVKRAGDPGLRIIPLDVSDH